jgi:hypothetical protein
LPKVYLKTKKMTDIFDFSDTR